MSENTKKQNQTDVEVLEKTDTETKGPWAIVIYNDDYNTFEHVIGCLIKYVGMNPFKAIEATFAIHNEGRAMVKTGDYDTLRPIHDELLDNFLSSKIEES